MKKIFINVTSSETRIAIVENNDLVEFYSEQPDNERMVGDIYKGSVTNIVNPIQAAFVDIGLKQNGFLPFAEVGREYVALTETVNTDKGKGKKKYIPPANMAALKKGQDILVQITKEPIMSKGARLTSDISIPGRFIVLVPGEDSIGVSRKIHDFKEKRRLRVLASSIKPKGFGLIIRTVAVGQSVQTLQSDLDHLLSVWKKITNKFKSEPAPELLHKDMGMASSVIRDLFSPDIESLVVDSRKLYNEIKKYLNLVAPSLVSRLEYYKDRTPLFDKYHIEEEIEKSLQRKIWMKNGGHIIFDQTEAMNVIDVNSGKSIKGKDHEKHALKIDLEAAKTIVKQLRLRDLGGIVVVDFIDLADEKNRKKVVSQLRSGLKKDRAAFDILPMNDFGLVAFTRERIRPSLLYRSSETCPRCNGLGMVPAKSTIMTKLERKIQNLKNTTGERRLVLRAHPALALYLKKGVRSRIQQLKVKYFVSIKIKSDGSINEEDFILNTVKEDKKNLTKKGFLPIFKKRDQ
ncbi:Rne/Rng family ribonuclease [bacterium]|nr:Rne/Rng family ribonuclease [bacterium]